MVKKVVLLSAVLVMLLALAATAANKIAYQGSKDVTINLSNDETIAAVAMALSFGKPGEAEGHRVGRDASRVPVILISPRSGPVVNPVSGYRRVGTGVPCQLDGSRCIRRRGITPATTSVSSTIGN